MRTVIMVPLPWFGTSLRRRRWDKYGIIGLTMGKKLLAGIFGIVGLVVEEVSGREQGRGIGGMSTRAAAWLAWSLFLSCVALSMDYGA